MVLFSSGINSGNSLYFDTIPLLSTDILYNIWSSNWKHWKHWIILRGIYSVQFNGFIYVLLFAAFPTLDRLFTLFTIDPKYRNTENFLKVVVHVIIIDKCNQTARMYEIQVTVIYSRANLVVVISECRVKRVICKTWTGTLANSADPDQTPQNAAYDQVLHCFLELQEIKGSIKVLNPCSGPFSQPTLRQSTHQCWQCFGYQSI